jgi:hypothetical protein
VSPSEAELERQTFDGRGHQHQTIFDHRQSLESCARERQTHETEIELLAAKRLDLLDVRHVAQAEIDVGDTLAQPH